MKAMKLTLENKQVPFDGVPYHIRAEYDYKTSTIEFQVLCEDDKVRVVRIVSGHIILGHPKTDLCCGTSIPTSTSFGKLTEDEEDEEDEEFEDEENGIVSHVKETAEHFIRSFHTVGGCIICKGVHKVHIGDKVTILNKNSKHFKKEFEVEEVNDNYTCTLVVTSNKKGFIIIKNNYLGVSRR